MARQLRRIINGKAKSLRIDDPEMARSGWKTLARNEDWARYYWDDLDAPQRKAMLDALAKVSPFKTLLELGCNSGPNLRLIRERFPDSEVTGIEMNQETVEAGKQYFRDAGLNGVTLKQGTFDQHYGRFDVALSVWSLTCSPPSEVGKVLSTIDAGSIIVVEPSCVGKSRIHLDVPTWRHDYARLLQERGFDVEIIPVDLNHVDKLFIGLRRSPENLGI